MSLKPAGERPANNGIAAKERWDCAVWDSAIAGAIEPPLEPGNNTPLTLYAKALCRGRRAAPQGRDSLMQPVRESAARSTSTTPCQSCQNAPRERRRHAGGRARTAN